LSEKFQILQGDAREVLPRLAKNTAERGRYRLAVTSPPYYGHRKYGSEPSELGQEKTPDEFIEELAGVFKSCMDLLTDDGSLFIVIGDTRRRRHKLMVPHRLALRLVDLGYHFQEDIIWYKRNAISQSSRQNLTQAYEFVLVLSKSDTPAYDIDPIRVQGNEALSGINSKPADDRLQFAPGKRDPEAIGRIAAVIHGSTPGTPFDELPTTGEISWAHGYDPEKYCPTCYRKFRRHATRKRIGGHEHYPIFAACNPRGKNPGNVWEISTKAHHGNEHFAVFPEDLVSRIVKFATKEGDYVLDPFAGRGTTGIVSACLKRGFTGIDLYPANVARARRNVQDSADSRLSKKVLDQIMPERQLTGYF